MKLAIVVVYLVSDENEKLLDLHLRQIEKHTRTPYGIYATVNRLLPKFRQKLERHPKVQICKCPTTHLRGSDENSLYLEHLVKMAIRDGATHVVVLHVDSFPIRSGWGEELVQKLSESSVLVAIMRQEDHDRKPHPACLLFHRDFYLKYHPTFRLSKIELSSPKYRQYLDEVEHIADCGVGYGFKVYSEGLSWHPLLKSNKAEGHYLFGTIYGDLIFHLGSATHKYKLSHIDIQRLNRSKSKNPLNMLLFLGSVLFSSRVKDIAMAVLPRRFMGPYASADAINRDAYESVRQRLLENPDSYLNYLRTYSLDQS